MSEDIKDNLPAHEKLKRELCEKFKASNTYLGSFIKAEITKEDFKVLKQSVYPPLKIKKGDVILLAQGAKTRPCVVIKVLKDRTVVYIPLSSSDNIHCLTTFTSRFLGEGCFCKSYGICDEETAIKNFSGVFDNMKDLNKGIKALKEYIKTIEL